MISYADAYSAYEWLAIIECDRRAQQLPELSPDEKIETEAEWERYRDELGYWRHAERLRALLGGKEQLAS